MTEPVLSSPNVGNLAEVRGVLFNPYCIKERMKWASTALNSGLKNYGAGLTAFTSDLFLSLLSITQYRVKENISERKPRALTRNSTALMNSSKEQDRENERQRGEKRTGPPRLISAARS